MLVRTSPSGLIEPCLPSTAERPPSGADCGPLETRKATLASLLRSCPPGARFNEHLKHDGEVVFRHACKLGLEGIVSKRRGSIYRSGKCKDWLKFKNPDAPAVKREAEEDWGRWNERDRPSRMADLGVLADLDGLAVAALIGATIGMAIAIALAGMVAGTAVEHWWSRRQRGGR
jgi:hypothetical protein